MNDSDIAEMLVLAGLTYRGFEDVASDEIHEGAVRGAVANGLATLACAREVEARLGPGHPSSE